jgi:PAS domain S-box-containing protein
MSTEREFGLHKAINELLELALQELSLPEILRRSLDAILALPWLALESKGSISLVRGDAGTLELMAARGLPESLLHECARIPFGRCICGRAASMREIVYADCVDERHEVRYEGITPHGHYCVPILFRGSVLGVINLYLKVGHPTTPEEIAFLNAIANTLAGVIRRSTIEEERELLIDRLQDALTVIGLSQQEWRETFDGITDMIAVLAPDGTLLKVNEAYAAFFQRHPRDLVDVQCRDLCPALERPVCCPLPQALAQKRPITEEIRDPGSGRVFRVSTFPCTGAAGAVNRVIHIARDITEERERQQRLVVSERLAALGQMASGIAHEINNPLASIAGCAEGLVGRVEKGKLDDALLKNYLSIIQEEAFRCKKITTSMLSFVRETDAERRRVPIDEVLDGVLEAIGFQGRLREVEVVRNRAAGLPALLLNEGEVRQVLLAVITNALDAMQDRGRLELETRLAGDGVTLSVTDSGCGIAAEHLDKVFNPFFTTKSARGGTGLGLSIARRIVTDHGGHIAIARAPGAGTAVTVTLPLSAQSG